jgi:hypothetical protein
VENKAAYIAATDAPAAPDPFEELKTYLSPKDVARLLNQLRAVWSLGSGWGSVKLIFKRSKMCRPVTEISAGEEGDCNI